LDWKEGEMTALKQSVAWWLVVVLGLVAGCGQGEPDAGTGPRSTRHAAGGDDSTHVHVKGPHGGELIRLDGGAGQVEFLHDAKAGRVDLHVLGSDGKSPLKIEAAPAVNLKTADGPRRFACRPVDGAGAAASHFQAIDPAFKTEGLAGQIAVSVEGKDYFVAIPHHHHEGDGHAGHAHGENTISRTVWTDRCEWFVELDTPEAGHATTFAAHITRLDDFKPVTAGAFRVEASSGEQTAGARVAAPADPGIFTPSVTFLTPGEWTLVLTYSGPAGLTDSIECKVPVYAHGKVPEPAADDARAISFLKEQQWKIPFATTAVVRREVGPRPNVIAVPEAAVRDVAGAAIVIVQTGGESFKERTLKTGARADGWVEIVSGLEEGERVVTLGAEAIQRAVSE
jgi:hypothetical protein